MKIVAGKEGEIKLKKKTSNVYDVEFSPVICEKCSDKANEKALVQY